MIHKPIEDTMQPAEAAATIRFSHSGEWVTSGTRLSWGTAQGKRRELKDSKRTPKPCGGPLTPEE
jgi:hypothetical protein